MSLLSGASIWTNDDLNKKKIPAMRKTIKKLPSNYLAQSNLNQADEYVSEDQNYQEIKINSIDETITTSENRSSRVNELLNKMSETTVDNTGSNLVNFNPPQNPELMQKKGFIINEDELNRRPILSPPIIRKEMGEMNYGANNLNLAKLSNYQTSYEAPSNTYYSKMGLGGSGGGNNQGSDKIMEKINYLIHMLETERDEKNDTIIQDFVLYTFLGVFIIFIVDSFSRGGKYSR